MALDLTPSEQRGPYEMHDNFSPIVPPHPDLADPNRTVDAPILLYRGPLRGRLSDVAQVYSCFANSSREQLEGLANELQNGVACPGEVTFVLSPDPHISWFHRSDQWPAMIGWPKLVPPAALSSHFATRSGPNGPNQVIFRERVGTTAGHSRLMYPVRVGASDDLLDEIKFYLLNFQVLYLCDDVEHTEKRGEKARLRLSANGWRVDIDRRPDFPEALSSHLEVKRGYAVTHNCRVWRENDDRTREQFTFEDAEPALEAIQLFASFVRGGLVGMALPVGFRGDISVFEEWHVTPVDPGRYPDPGRPWPLPGWYPLYDRVGVSGTEGQAATWLPLLFEQFAKRWWHPDNDLRDFWRTMFRELIYTYTDAERADKRRAIVPACTALETLAWSILVVSEKWLTGDKHPEGGRGGYEKLSAADRLRLLLSWAGISTEIPTDLPSLSQNPGTNWDGPQVATWVRNRVVHPDKHDQLTEELATHAWLLAMWYTELVILKLCDYGGYFRDRLDGEKVKRVPWATD